MNFKPTLSLEQSLSPIYDIILIGAGPAGTTCGSYLAQMGAKVLLLDRSKFPRRKPCGDAIMFPALRELEQLGIREEVEALAHPIEEVGIFMSTRAIERNKTVGCVLPREQFDALLLSHAQKVGADFLDQVQVQRVRVHESGKYIEVYGVSLQNTKRTPCIWRSYLVIVADGSGSTIARQIRKELEDQQIDPLVPPASPRWSFVARSAYFQLPSDPKMLAFYFGEEAWHYAWVFPYKDSIANVGLIASKVQVQQAREQGKEPFPTGIVRFLARYGNSHALIGRIQGAPLTTALRGTCLYHDHVLIVGDAAGFIEPQSGEGISGALWSARQAAIIALEALNKQNYSRAQLVPYADAVLAHYDSWLLLPE